MLGFIWAEDLVGNIGYKGKLPWYLPADLKNFKKRTINHPIVMGRKTFESLPQILPKRLHVVLTTDKQFAKKYENEEKVKVLTNLIQLRRWIKEQGDKEIWVIGGASIFDELKGEVEILERTIISGYFKGDVSMPKIDYAKFKIINYQVHQADTKNKYNYTFIRYKKRVSRKN